MLGCMGVGGLGGGCGVASDADWFPLGSGSFLNFKTTAAAGCVTKKRKVISGGFYVH